MRISFGRLYAEPVLPNLPFWTTKPILCMNSPIKDHTDRKWEDCLIFTPKNGVSRKNICSQTLPSSVALTALRAARKSASHGSRWRLGCCSANREDGKSTFKKSEFQFPAVGVDGVKGDTEKRLRVLTLGHSLFWASCSPLCSVRSLGRVRKEKLKRGMSK